MPPQLPEKPDLATTLDTDLEAEIQSLKDVRAKVQAVLSDSAELETDVAKVSTVVKEVGEALTLLVFIPGVGPEIAAVGTALVGVGTVVGAVATHWAQIQADVKTIDVALGNLIAALEEARTASGKLHVLVDAVEDVFRSIEKKVEEAAEWVATTLEDDWKKVTGELEDGKAGVKDKRMAAFKNPPLSIKTAAEDIQAVANEALAAGKRFFEAPAKPDATGVEIAAADANAAAGKIQTLNAAITKGIADGDQIASDVAKAAEVARYLGDALQEGAVIPVIGPDLAAVGKALVAGGEVAGTIAGDWGEVKTALGAVQTLLATADAGLELLAKALTGFEQEKAKLEGEYKTISDLVKAGQDWQALEAGWTDLVGLFDDAKAAAQQAESAYESSAASVTGAIATLEKTLRI